MKTQYMRTGNFKDNIINQIINKEWEMFQAVKNIGGRAPCQGDGDTFYIMRYSQHSLLGINVLESYHLDLIDAIKNNRNPVMEKYAYMMEDTSPAYFNSNIKGHIPLTVPEKVAIIEEILAIMSVSKKEFALKYPKLNVRGRPDGNEEGVTSFLVYLEGELKTYSTATLSLYLCYIKELVEIGINPVCVIQNQTVSFYGYSTLEEVEHKL